LGGNGPGAGAALIPRPCTRAGAPRAFSNMEDTGQHSIFAIAAAVGGCSAVVGGAFALAVRKPAPIGALWYGLNGAFLSGTYTASRRFFLSSDTKTEVEAGMAAGGVSGLLFGLVCASTPRGKIGCFLGGALLATAGEVGYIKLQERRLASLLEEKYPGLRPKEEEKVPFAVLDAWWWPEWLPIQHADRRTDLAVYDKRIRELQHELLFLSTWEAPETTAEWS